MLTINLMPRDPKREGNRRRSRRWYEVHRAEANAYSRRWRQENPAKRYSSSRNSHLKRTYGITLAEVEALLRAQAGGCALCATLIRQGGRAAGDRLCVDHDHATGRIRGLLCTRCNNALGTLGDDEAGLLRALAYVRGT